MDLMAASVNNWPGGVVEDERGDRFGGVGVHRWHDVRVDVQRAADGTSDRPDPTPAVAECQRSSAVERSVSPSVDTGNPFDKGVNSHTCCVDYLIPVPIVRLGSEER